jgi:FtsH-binding integral membrane protein
MTSTLTYQQMGTTARSQTHTLFAQTMGYVALTAALFALGAWAGHNLTGGVGIIAFIAAFGAAGYATRRDLTALARVSFWALLALIVAGIVLTFVHIPGGDLVYSILGLVIFAGFTMFDFQRLRTNTDTNAAPLLAASIFLDILNVFLFFLAIFSGGRE